MKKILYSSLAIASVLGFSSCNETWDENPVLNGHTGTVQADFLNEPVLGETNLMLTTENQNGYFHLTASQPDYGFAAVATYRVQCSLTPDFTDYREINQDFYKCNEINPLNSEVAAALEYLSDVKTDADLPLPYQTLYMRLHAYIQQAPELTEYISNVVSFKGVSANYLAIWVADQPANLYIRGDMNGWGADSAYQFMTGTDENSWKTGVITINAGEGFKVADDSWGPVNLGSGDADQVTPGEAFTLNNDGSSGNLFVTSNFTGVAYLYLEKGVYTLILDPQ